MLLFLNISFSSAQEEDDLTLPEKSKTKNSKKKSQGFSFDKVFFGGNLGLQFGTITQIIVAPTVGYHFTDRFSAGIGGTYQYYSDSRYNFNTSVYGGSIFGRFILIKDLFLYSEVEALNIDDMEIYQNTLEMKRIWVTSVLVGGGYRQRIGERAAINLMLLWNINETSKSPYTNPIVRVGFEF